MKTSELHLHRDELDDRLLPRLVGRVFHVTSLTSLDQILASGEIRPNVDGQFPTTFGFSSNSFFRKRGCVSLFDYRFASAEQIDTSISKCSPFYMPRSDHKIAYLFLSADDHHRLILWTKWNEEQSSEMIVPYVEAGYPGCISITSIEEVLRVIIDYPPDPLIEALEKGRSRAASR